MASITFTVTHEFDAPPQIVWAEMIDWEGHGAWVPATRVEVDGPDSQAVGATFTGYTGYGPLTLVDRMRVSEIGWDDSAGKGECVVEKLGPVLRGTAGFTVSERGEGSRVDWFEDVTVPYLPGFLAPIVSKVSALGFSLAMKRLAKVIDRKRAASLPSVT